jgi:DNA polymerase-3 subunit gamma/tau
VSYQVFARKYRPRTFDDVLGQDHVMQTLRNAIGQDRLAHAYLFVGPRGTGKTSTARIFAKALNCTDGPKVDFDPDESVCIEIAEGRSLDVLEIDGASNNGVEQVRELRETVNYAPASGRFKIYYIDEVHMLTNQAFNALLKTLEEPPEHVKFIFATTEPNKILPTILSRCQRFDLRPIPTEIIAQHLQYIAKEEGVTLDDSAAWAIAKGADGGMRDAQSMLDQLVAFCGETITEPNVQEIFGFTSVETVAGLATAILEKETADAIARVQTESEKGKDLTQLLGELTGFLRSLLIARLNPGAPAEGLPEELWQEVCTMASKITDDRLLAVLDQLANADSVMRRASNKQLHFEIALIKSVQSLDEVRISDVIKALEAAPQVAPAAPEPSPAVAPPATVIAPRAPAKPSQPAKTPSSSSVEDTFSKLIAKAPEERDEPDSQPGSAPPSPAPTNSASPPAEEVKPVPAEDFYKDPLIKEAVRLFHGKLKE